MKVFEKTSGIVSRRIAGELFVVPVSGDLADMQRMFALTGVAGFIWDRLDGRNSLDRIRDQVMEEFDADRNRVDADIQEFVRELLNEGLISEAAK